MLASVGNKLHSVGMYAYFVAGWLSRVGFRPLRLLYGYALVALAYNLA